MPRTAAPTATHAKPTRAKSGPEVAPFFVDACGEFPTRGPTGVDAPESVAVACGWVAVAAGCVAVAAGCVAVDVGVAVAAGVDVCVGVAVATVVVTVGTEVGACWFGGLLLLPGGLASGTATVLNGGSSAKTTPGWTSVIVMARPATPIARRPNCRCVICSSSRGSRPPGRGRAANWLVPFSSPGAEASRVWGRLWAKC